MTRTWTPPISDRNDPSGNLRSTGGGGGGGAPDQEPGPGGGDFGEEVPGAGATVHQRQHRLVQQVQQPARPGQLAVGGRAEHRTEQCAGAGFAQGHQLDERVAGPRPVQLSQPGPVPRRAGTLTDRHPPDATVRYRPNITPGVRGHAAGPASTPDSTRKGAGPRRRRRSRSAFISGQRTSSPPVSFARTPRYPVPGNKHIASTK